MKLLIAWLTMSLVVFVGSQWIKEEKYVDPSEDELENAMPYGIDDLSSYAGSDDSEADPEDRGKCNDTISICKPITANTVLRVLNQLGVLKNPAIRIFNVSKRFLKYLRRNNGTLRAHPRQKRSGNNGMCNENNVVVSYHLIHPHVNLVYQTHGVICTSHFCSAPTFCSASPIGNCVLKKAIVVLQLFKPPDDYLYTKTVEVGSACKCALFP